VYDSDVSSARYQVTKSLVENFDLSIYSGVKGHDGRDYSWFGLGHSLLAVPFYIIGKYTGTPENTVSAINLIIGAATVSLVFLFSKVLSNSNHSSILIALFYGLGTFAWPLAKQPFDHTVETFFALSSVYFAYIYTLKKHPRHLLFSSFCLGFAFITRLTALLILPALFLLIFNSIYRRSDVRTALKTLSRDVLLFSAVLLPFACLALWYNYYRFGSVFETGYSLIAMKTGLDFFSGTPLLTGLSGLLLSPGKGFFYYSPIAILALFSFRYFMKQHRSLSLAFLLIIASQLLLISKNIYWHGDWAWGPRYLLVLTPFFIIPIAGFLDSIEWRKKQFKRIAVCSIFALSLMVQIVAVSVYFQIYFFHIMYDDGVKFSVAEGPGVQKITEPPADIYFDWRFSPIIKTPVLMFDTAKRMMVYNYGEPPADASFYDQLKSDPYYNVLDYWWLYRYFADNSSSGFVGAVILILIAVYMAMKLRAIAQEYEGRH